MEQNRLSELIRKYADRTASTAEIEELQSWYRTVHAAEVVEWPAAGPEEADQLRLRMLARLRQRMQETPAESVAPVISLQDPLQNPLPETGTRIVLPRIRTWVRVAAVCILVVTTWLIVRNKPENWVVVNNPSGTIEKIVLPDNSQVWLNASSTLKYAENFRDNRKIELEGEGYFDVTEDKQHPFQVLTGCLSTTVLGTSFDVKYYAEEQRQTITVIRGKVRVDQAQSSLDVLTPARQLQYDISHATSQTVTVDTNQVVGWQQGKFIFQGQTLEEITTLLGRRYKVSFKFATPALKGCRMYAHFEQSQSLKQILNALSIVIDLQFSIDEKTHIVTLSGKGC